MTPGSISIRRIATGLVVLAVVAGCATAPKPQALSPAQQAMAEQQQSAREAQLRLRTEWSLAGRIAVSNRNNGGSGRIDWEHDGRGYRIALSAPVTRQSWQLSVDGATGWARLEGLEGGPRAGPDAAMLLHEATGWDIPVASLGDWVRGLRSPADAPAALQFGGDLRPLRLVQGGWDITYTWPEGAGANTFPARVDARRGEARVRLIIDQWGDAGGNALGAR